MMQYRFQISPTTKNTSTLQIQIYSYTTYQEYKKDLQIKIPNNIFLPQDLSRCGQISFLSSCLRRLPFFLLKIESRVVRERKKYKLSILPKYQ